MYELTVCHAWSREQKGLHLLYQTNTELGLLKLRQQILIQEAHRYTP